MLPNQSLIRTRENAEKGMTDECKKAYRFFKNCTKSLLTSSEPWSHHCWRQMSLVPFDKCQPRIEQEMDAFAKLAFDNIVPIHDESKCSTFHFIQHVSRPMKYVTKKSHSYLSENEIKERNNQIDEKNEAFQKESFKIAARLLKHCPKTHSSFYAGRNIWPKRKHNCFGHGGFLPLFVDKNHRSSNDHEEQRENVNDRRGVHDSHFGLNGWDRYYDDE